MLNISFVDSVTELPNQLAQKLWHGTEGIQSNNLFRGQIGQELDYFRERVFEVAGRKRLVPRIAGLLGLLLGGSLLRSEAIFLEIIYRQLSYDHEA